jgi:hypothetical protein
MVYLGANASRMESRLLVDFFCLGLAKEFLPRINWFKAMGMIDVGLFPDLIINL